MGGSREGAAKEKRNQEGKEKHLCYADEPKEQLAPSREIGDRLLSDRMERKWLGFP